MENCTLLAACIFCARAPAITVSSGNVCPNCQWLQLHRGRVACGSELWNLMNGSTKDVGAIYSTSRKVETSGPQVCSSGWDGLP